MDDGAGYSHQWILQIGENRFPIGPDGLRVGRAPGTDVTLVDTTVSKLHAILYLHEGQCHVRDENSSNGTFVAGRRITAPQTVEPGDEVYFGGVAGTIHIAEGSDPAQPGASPDDAGSAAEPQPLVERPERSLAGRLLPPFILLTIVATIIFAAVQSADFPPISPTATAAPATLVITATVTLTPTVTVTATGTATVTATVTPTVPAALGETPPPPECTGGGALEAGRSGDQAAHCRNRRHHRCICWRTHDEMCGFHGCLRCSDWRS